MALPILKPDKRVIISGRTGCGKSTLACWLLLRSQQHYVILNPKWTAAYSELPDSIVISDITEKSIDKAILEYRFVMLNFPGHLANPEFIDSVISYLHYSYNNIGLCADELYILHNNARAYPGLLGWLTRGRELNQGFLGLTQRPAWISKFCYSESDQIIAMTLPLKKDRQTLVESTGNNYFMDKVDPYHWYYFDVKSDIITHYGPIPLKK